MYNTKRKIYKYVAIAFVLLAVGMITACGRQQESEKGSWKALK